eukprot:767106-Hanusia_phi.AAC.2
MAKFMYPADSVRAPVAFSVASKPSSSASPKEPREEAPAPLGGLRSAKIPSPTPRSLPPTTQPPATGRSHWLPARLLPQPATLLTSQQREKAATSDLLEEARLVAGSGLALQRRYHLAAITCS